MKRLGFVLVLAVSALAFLHDATPAAACSCIGEEPEKKIEQANAIFSGRVMFVAGNVDIDSLHEYQNVVGFWVSEVWKGPVQGFVYVKTRVAEASCGYTFETGRQYLVYATEGAFGYSTSLCSGNRDISPGARYWEDPPVDLELLGQGRVPSSWVEPRSVTIQPIEMAVWGVALVIAGFILAAGSILGYKRFRKR